MKKYIIQKGLVQDTITTTRDNIVISGSKVLYIPLKEDFLKWRLNNPDAEIVEINPYNKPYTHEDKLAFLKKKHPHIQGLIDNFDLELP